MGVLLGTKDLVFMLQLPPGAGVGEWEMQIVAYLSRPTVGKKALIFSFVH